VQRAQIGYCLADSKSAFWLLAALKRDFNITEIEGVSTRIITEALASAVEQSAYVWYARVPGQYWYTRSTVPPIHDITTDIT